MVIRDSAFTCGSRRGSLIIEMVIGMAFLLVTILPLAYSFAREQRYARACYLRTVAMEVVDGEMEILAAGEWRAFKSGTQAYVPSRSTVNLSDGKFALKISGKHLRLEWQADEKDHGGKVIREVTLK